MEEFKLTNEQSAQLYNIALGIAQRKYHQYRYYGSMDAKDMASELYIKGVELTKKLGRFEPNLLAKAMYNDVVDVIRKEQQRVHTGYDINELDYNPELNKNLMTHNATELADVYDVLRVVGEPDGDFPSPESKNKEYWYIWLLYKLDVEGDDEVIKKVLAMPENAWMQKPRWKDKWPVDDIIATTLGYAGNHSSAFQKVKWRARQLLTNEGFN